MVSVFRGPDLPRMPLSNWLINDRSKKKARKTNASFANGGLTEGRSRISLLIATIVVRIPDMAATTSIRIDRTLYDHAKADAAAEHRTIAGQVEFWARVGRAALDNPDLPVSFVADSLASLSEPRSQATSFVPRKRAK